MKAPHIEDMEMEIKELKRGQKHDREQIERSDTFVSKLQGQIGTQQMRIDGLQEVRSMILSRATQAVRERDLDSPGHLAACIIWQRLIAERDRAAILEGQRRRLLDQLGQTSDTDVAKRQTNDTDVAKAVV